MSVPLEHEEPPLSSGPPQPMPTRASVVYLTSRFPKVTETFVIDEIALLQSLGLPVRVLSLLRADERVVHPAAVGLMGATTYGSRSASRLLSAQLHWLRRRPSRLLATWWTVLTGNRSSFGEWAKSVVTAALAVEWARSLEGEQVVRLHAHWATHPTLAAWVLARLLDRPYGFTAHAHDLYGENGMLARKVADADLVITISEFNRALLQRRLGPAADRVQVLHCGVDLQLLSATPIRSGPLAPAELLCVASLTDYKGHRYLLDALRVLTNSGRSVRCTLVGDGPLREALEAQARDLGLQDVLVFAGRRTAPQVHDHLRACDVFVLPSIVTSDGKMEGIPVALMEALASGRPVVTSELSGIPELVEHERTGLLVPPGDASALATGLDRLLGDDVLRARLAGAGPGTVAAGFDLRTNVAWLHDRLREGAG